MSNLKNFDYSRVDTSSSGTLEVTTMSKPADLYSVWEQSTLSFKRLLFSETSLLLFALVSLLGLSWGFIVATAIRPFPIPIPSTQTQFLLWSFPKLIAYTVTPISTSFAIIVGFLYTRCLRLAAKRSLTQKLSIRAFSGWTALINERVMGLPFGAGSGWAQLSLLSAILLATLTTGLNGFFTPQSIPQNRKIQSFPELDMSTDAFLYTIYQPMSQNLKCRYGNYTFFSCSNSRPPKPLRLLDAGESAAFSDLVYDGYTSFAQTTFFGTSGGVMPAGAYVNAIWFFGRSSDPYYMLPLYFQASWNYNISYLQQGLTADVSCTWDDSSPLSYTTISDISTGETGSSLSLIMPAIACTDAEIEPLPQQIVGADFVLASLCSFPNQTQQLYLRGYGAYRANSDDHTPSIANMTCILNPIFTINNVTFNAMSGTVNVAATHGVPAVPNSNTTLIVDITSALTIAVADGQTGDGNIFADLVQGVIVAYSAFGEKPLPYQVVQSMFRGMFEASGLAINGYWSSKLFEDANPLEILNSPSSRKVEGYLNYSFYGWNGDTQSIVGLVPFTVVIIISLVLLFQSYHDGPRLRFDPSNPLHIMIASAAGDFGHLSNVNIEKDNIKKISTEIQYTRALDGRWALTDKVASA